MAGAPTTSNDHVLRKTSKTSGGGRATRRQSLRPDGSLPPTASSVTAPKKRSIPSITSDEDAGRVEAAQVQVNVGEKRIRVDLHSLAEVPRGVQVGHKLRWVLKSKVCFLHLCDLPFFNSFGVAFFNRTSRV